MTTRRSTTPSSCTPTTSAARGQLSPAVTTIGNGGSSPTPTATASVCAGDGYIRLFQLNHLVIDFFPRDYYDFPLPRMDNVCQHCPFGTVPAKQRDVGRPVSPIYAAQFRTGERGGVSPPVSYPRSPGANAAPFANTDHRSPCTSSA